MAAGDSLTGLVTERGVLVADGGMGTSVFDMGLEPGGCVELWNVEHPRRIAQIHHGYVAAGADIILTNTFGGNRLRLGLHGLGDRVGELNHAAARIARDAVESVSRQVLVAGSIGPTGELFQPSGTLTHSAGRAVFDEQVAGLVEGGVDILWIETMSSLEELSAAYEAAAVHKIPVVATMSFDSHGHTMMGVSPTAFADWEPAQSRHPAAIGANCGIGPGEALLAVLEMRRVNAGAVLVAKSNCGTPYLEGATPVYPTSPGEAADYARYAIDVGARIIGTCCGSTADHIRAIRQAVDTHQRRPAPTPEQVASRLGMQQRTTRQRKRARHASMGLGSA